MARSRKWRRLSDAYAFPGFRPLVTVRGVFGDPKARRYAGPAFKKTVCGSCGTAHFTWYDRTHRRIRDLAVADYRIYVDLEIRRVRCRSCGTVNGSGWTSWRTTRATRSGLPFMLAAAVAAQ